MTKESSISMEIPKTSTIEVYTSLEGQEYNDTILDSLSLIRRGIIDLSPLYGEAEINEALGDFTMDIPEVFNPSKFSYQNTWAYHQSRENGKPMFLVSRNSIDGVNGAADCREYTYTYTLDGSKEEAIFINWIAVSNVANNENSAYSYRGAHLIGNNIYDKIEEIAREHGVTLLIAGVHSNNVNARKFHLHRGFSNQPWFSHPEKSHPTQGGAYLKDTPADENDPAKGSIKYYTKRLEY